VELLMISQISENAIKIYFGFSHSKKWMEIFSFAQDDRAL